MRVQRRERLIPSGVFDIFQVASRLELSVILWGGERVGARDSWAIRCPKASHRPIAFVLILS